VWQQILLPPVLTQFALTHSAPDEQVAPSALLPVTMQVPSEEQTYPEAHPGPLAQDPAWQAAPSQ
jgi:hypothetical protein